MTIKIAIIKKRQKMVMGERHVNYYSLYKNIMEGTQNISKMGDSACPNMKIARGNEIIC